MVDTADFQFMKCVVVKTHNATDETQLELRLNDIVYVLEQDDSGWWGGHKEGEDCTGWFPGSCVRELESSAGEPETETLGVEAAERRGLSVVPEEEKRSSHPSCTANCEHGLDLDEALHRENRMVASPNRRVSGASTSVADAAAFADIQAQLKTSQAIAEDRAREIQQLQGKLTELEAGRKSDALTNKRQIEDLRRQNQMQEDMKQDLQKELARHRENAGEVPSLRAEISTLMQQLAKSQQETRDRMNECSQLQRQVSEKDAEIHDLRQQQILATQAVTAPQLPAQALFCPSSSPPPACDDTRRRLFPSTMETAPLIPGAGGTPSFSMNDIANEVVNSQSSVQSASSAETARPNSCRPPSYKANSSTPRPFGSGVRGGSLTRPAFRPLPNALSPGGPAMSPGGLSKCLSTGDLPPTPRIETEQEAPPTGGVKDKIGFFEKRGNTPGPKGRSSVHIDGRPLAVTPSSQYNVPVPGAHRSPTEQRWQQKAYNATHGQRQAFQHAANTSHNPAFPGLSMMETEDVVDGPVNFNMSPMRRHA